MQITTASREDLPEIIEVLKRSLGEGLLPKSVDYFVWKHYKNPFGESQVILAREEGKIIGVRAFMKWNWTRAGNTITTVRAVDTATDPVHQGKGIFKKLTMQAVHDCTQAGVPFVFNSPNTMSMPGYLKMGWMSSGRLPLFVGLGSIFPRFHHKGLEEELVSRFNIVEALDKLPSSWVHATEGDIYHTPLSKAYLDWRYRACPVVRYGAVIESGKFGFVFRLKKWKWMLECRICEVWMEPGCKEEEIRRALKKMLTELRPVLVTCAASPAYESKRNQPFGMIGPIARGPIITLRTLAQTNLDSFRHFARWMPSLGSIELF
jgi:N-acetylglutamate synthase-like GNAT family acetyltransferase